MEVYAYNGQNLDLCFYFKACDLIKGMILEFCVEVMKLWWKHEGGSLEEVLKPFRNNGDAVHYLVLLRKVSVISKYTLSSNLLHVTQHLWIRLERKIRKRNLMRILITLVNQV